jgi:hypothetical protein
MHPVAFALLPMAAALAVGLLLLRLQSKRESSPAGIAKFWRTRFAPCQACGESLIGHRLYELFKFIEATELRMADIDKDVDARNWRVFVGENKYDGTRDSFEYWFVECPATESGGLYRVISFAELYGPEDQFDRVGVLDPEETTELLTILGNKSPREL